MPTTHVVFIFVAIYANMTDVNILGYSADTTQLRAEIYNRNDYQYYPVGTGLFIPESGMGKISIRMPADILKNGTFLRIYTDGLLELTGISVSGPKSSLFAPTATIDLHKSYSSTQINYDVSQQDYVLDVLKSTTDQYAYAPLTTEDFDENQAK